MAALTSPAGIASLTFLNVLFRYQALTSSPSSATKPVSSSSSTSTTEPTTLQELDSWRINALPHTLWDRGQEGRMYLSHDELEKLVKCKMRRGKFRPTLLPLVTSNSASTVEKITSEAFGYLKGHEKPIMATVKTALDHLSKNLKGIGPATASYVLAAQVPHWIPAFSDEAFRWVFTDEHKPGVIKGSKGDGWNRKMDYSIKEYIVFMEKVWETSERLIAEYKANDKRGDQKEEAMRELFGAGSVEMVGWVLGKEAAGWQPGELQSSKGQQQDQTGKRKRGHLDSQDDEKMDSSEGTPMGKKTFTSPRGSISRKVKKAKQTLSDPAKKKEDSCDSTNRESLRRSSRNKKLK